MQLFERILVPTDFSPNAEEAVRYAAELARRFEAPLTLVHVYDVTPYVLPEAVPLYDTSQLGQLREEFQKQLSALRQRVEQSGVKQVEARLLQGSPTVEIPRFAEEQGFGLIVVGTHGRTGLAHLLLGSVAEKVVRKSPCPVLTVPLRQ